MRILLNLAIAFLLLTPALAHAQSHQPKEDKTKEEIQKLFSDLNEAITKKDRARLEQLYADEFQFIRPSGAVIDKANQIGGIRTNDPVSATPVPVPATVNLMTYGNVAIARHSVRGAAITSIFVKKNGQWQLLQAQATRLAPERKPVSIDPKVLDSFVGKYQFGPNAIDRHARRRCAQVARRQPHARDPRSSIRDTLLLERDRNRNDVRQERKRTDHRRRIEGWFVSGYKGEEVGLDD